MRTIRSMLILLGALGAAAPAPAQIVPLQEWCVTNSAELQAALTAAESNDKADIIKIATGNYPVPAGGFNYDALPEGSDDYFLTLEGGWTELFGNPCGQQLAQNPFLTVLNGGGSHRVMRIRGRENSGITVRLLTFINGYVPGSERGGGLEVQPSTSVSFNGNIVIERNMFLGNEAHVGSGLRVHFSAYETNARLGVVGNVFVGNHARANGAVSLAVSQGNAGSSGAGIRMTNNTVLANTAGTMEPDAIGGVILGSSVPNIYVVNNNLWGNQTSDLQASLAPNNDGFQLRNNNIGNRTGGAPTSESDNISVEPVYEPCFLCFTWVPVSNSPLVDGGTFPPTFSPFWYLTELDLKGEARVHSGKVDIGAYESHDIFFSDRFEQ